VRERAEVVAERIVRRPPRTMLATHRAGRRERCRITRRDQRSVSLVWRVRTGALPNDPRRSHRDAYARRCDGVTATPRGMIAPRDRRHATPRDVARETATQKAFARIVTASKNNR
jgi:hypothetical protein